MNQNSLTETIHSVQPLKLMRDSALGVFDFVAFIQHTVGPTTRLEPAILDNILIIRRDQDVKAAVAKAIP